MIRTTLIFVIMTLFVTACVTTQPRPAKSEYFASEGGGFLFESEKRQASYGLTLTPLKAIPGGSFIEIQFENPEGGKPLMSTHTVEWGENKFVFKSPPVKGLKAYTNYTIEVFLYKDNSKNNLLGIHRQDLQNLVNSEDLKW